MLRAGDELIPGYRLQAKLGHGAFGEVWRATGPGNTVLALKFLDLGGKTGLKEFRAIQRIKQIRHPLLLPITGLWVLDQNGIVFDEQFLQEWNAQPMPTEIPGRTMAVRHARRPSELVVAMLLGDKSLDDRLRECQRQGHVGIPPEELLIYLADAARAIDFLNSPRHDLGAGRDAIQHGDIKPQNILIVGETAQLCDFGLARLLSDSKTATEASFSAAYVAPEVIVDRKPSSSSDQYSLAITYFELRTGSLPFDGTTIWEVLEAHKESKLNLSKLSKPEQVVIQRATALEPSKRFPNTSTMVTALREACLSLPATSPTPTQKKNDNKKNDNKKKIEKSKPKSPPAIKPDPPKKPVEPVAVSPYDTVIPDDQAQAFESNASQLDPHSTLLMNSSQSDSSPALDPSSELSPWKGTESSVIPVISASTKHDRRLGARRLRLSIAFLTFAILATVTGFAIIQYLTINPRVARPSEDSTTIPKDPEGNKSNSVEPVSEGDKTIANPSPSTSSNLPPKIDTVEIVPENPIVGQAVIMRLGGSDPDGDIVRFEVRIATSSWKSIEGAIIPLNKRTEGVYDFEFRALDGGGATSEVVRRNLTIKPQVSRVLGIEFVCVELGEFTMGSTADELDRNSDETQHQVRLTKPLLLGKDEVTQAQFDKVMGFNPSYFKKGNANKLPVEMVSWFDAVMFCNRLSELEGKKPVYSIQDVALIGKSIQRARVTIDSDAGYRLPTEAEWEYACRAGTMTPFSLGGNLTSAQANFDGSVPYSKSKLSTYSEKTSPIDQFLSNAWGARNMHGNVWEWCWDGYADYPTKHVTDPTGDVIGTLRVFRGGGWYSAATGCRSAYRNRIAPAERNPSLGFRVAIRYDSPSP